MAASFRGMILYQPMFIPSNLCLLAAPAVLELGWQSEYSLMADATPGASAASTPLVILLQRSRVDVTVVRVLICVTFGDPFSIGFFVGFQRESAAAGRAGCRQRFRSILSPLCTDDCRIRPWSRSLAPTGCRPVRLALMAVLAKRSAGPQWSELGRSRGRERSTPKA